MMKYLALLCLLAIATANATTQVTIPKLPDGAMAIGQFSNKVFSRTQLNSVINTNDIIDTVTIGVYVKDIISSVFVVNGVFNQSIFQDHETYRGYPCEYLDFDLDDRYLENDYVMLIYSNSIGIISAKSLIDDVLDTFENPEGDKSGDNYMNLSIETNRIENEWFFLHVNEMDNGQASKTSSIFVGESNMENDSSDIEILVRLYIEYYDEEMAESDIAQLQDSFPVFIMMVQFF